MNTILYFGSFNPIHIGHLIIAQQTLDIKKNSELWFVVSPQNPFKKQDSLLAERDRLHLVNLAIEEQSNMKSSDIEFYLKRPSYTIDTLTHLSEKYPKRKFSILIGGDNLVHLHKWKNADILIRDYPILVYPRPGDEIPEDYKNVVQIIQAPFLEISATYIRKKIKDSGSIKYLVRDNVKDYIEEMGFYT